MSASSCVSEHQAAQLLTDRYLRVNGSLPRKLMQLDNTSETRVMDFQSYANHWFEGQADAIKSLIGRVAEAKAAAA